MYTDCMWDCVLNKGLNAWGVIFLFSSSDVAPLSAPAFSFSFPLLNAKLRESSGSTEETENMMTKALQVVMEHCKLRTVGTANLDFAVDEVDTYYCAFVPSLRDGELQQYMSVVRSCRRLTLLCFRLDQSCSHVSTCFCFWKALFQQQHQDSRYYRTSDYLFCVCVKLI